jgi:hypothetical protein
MTVTAASFRKDFPIVFGGQSAYPNETINYWLAVAGLMLTGLLQRAGPSSATADSPPTTIYDMLVEMFVAHNLILEKMAADAAQKGGNPGIVKGPITSISVGSVSISYDPSAALEYDSGIWALSIYGQRFIKLARFYGSGPVQIGIGVAPPFALGAWAGPITALGPDDWDQ